MSEFNKALDRADALPIDHQVEAINSEYLTSNEMDLLKEYILLDKVKKQREADLKAATKARDSVGDLAVEAMQASGCSSMKFGKEGVHLRSPRLVKKKPGVTAGDIVDALNASGMGYLVSYNANSLKSAVVELLDSAEAEVPTALADLLEIGTMTQIVATGISK